MRDYISESIEIQKMILSSTMILEQLRTVVFRFSEAFRHGGKVFSAGNGGSAADAQHFASEMVGRFKRERKGYPAIALTTDSAIITAWSNDYSFDNVFSRQLEALGKEGDIFLGISTSGNSKNIIEAVKKAKQLGIFSICLLGHDGGKIKNLTDISIIVPSDNTPRIQECHTLFIHMICEEVEKLCD